MGMTIALALLGRDLLRIRKKDISFFVLFGLFKFLTDLMFFYGQDNISLCLATLLQMTAPYFVRYSPRSSSGIR